VNPAADTLSKPSRALKLRTALRASTPIDELRRVRKTEGQQALRRLTALVQTPPERHVAQDQTARYDLFDPCIYRPVVELPEIEVPADLRGNQCLDVVELCVQECCGLVALRHDWIAALANFGCFRITKNASVLNSASCGKSPMAAADSVVRRPKSLT